MIEGVKIVGRCVWGHPLKAVQKRHLDGPMKGQLMKKDDGSPAMQWAYGIAVYKEATLRQMYAGNPQIEQIVAQQAFEKTVWPFMAQEAATGYPSGVPQKFSWKYQDGDGIDGEGKPYNQREGYAGCYVVTIATEAFAPPVWKRNPQTGQFDQLPADGVKCGDYLAADVSLQVNVPKERTHTPSLYVNPRGCELIGYGTEIQNRGTIDPNQAFGATQYMLPPGATLTPVQAPAGVAPPQMPSAPAQPGMPGQPPMMPGAPPAMPGMPAPVPVTTGLPTAPQMPPPAPDFARPGAVPGMPPAQPMAMPGQMPGMMPPPPAAPPPAPVPAVQRPIDPSHIHAPGTPGEMWWINGAWTQPPR